MFTNDKLSQTYFNVFLSHFSYAYYTYFTIRNKIRSIRTVALCSRRQTVRTSDRRTDSVYELGADLTVEQECNCSVGDPLMKLIEHGARVRPGMLVVRSRYVQLSHRRRYGLRVHLPAADQQLITFCVSRRRRKMYCGHARLCVCLPTLLHGPGCNLGAW